MKVFFVTMILGIGIFTLIISIDLLMGTKIDQLPQKEINPFQVMEPAEYFLIFLVAFFIVLNIIISFFKKKKGAKSP